MERNVAGILGIALAGLVVTGMLVDNKRPLEIMNVDDSHSMIRVPVAALLLYGAISPLKRARAILLSTGLFYWLIGIGGSSDRRLGGLLPSGLTAFDYVYHFTVGAVCVWLGSRPGRMLKR
ncbi:MAG TPA: hypothetical protein VF597_02780 [Candidatus Saccharimonadales bacterium]|jgi:hypothetical protein